jgi:DHA1 family bicyclomycin/chloramphenicol resistance-like MFS transporter
MSRFLDRASPPHILTLVVATAVSALATNVFLPSLPGMARYFGTDYAMAQLTVSVYLAATAILQLGIGPASDRFGRRPVMLFCLGMFVAGSAMAILAPTIEVLLAARVLQSFSAAGMVLARAIVRDTVASDEAASRIGYITMGMALVPMVAPVIGGLLEEIHGWQASFGAMLAFGLVAFTMAFLDLGETNRATTTGMAAQVRAYPGLLRLVPFWSYTLSMAFASGIFFVLVGAGPLVATAILGLSPSGYGLYFGLISLGYVIGNFLSGRYSRRLGTNAMTLYGNLVAASGVVIAFLLFASGLGSALSLFGPMTLVGIGNGMTMPNAGAGVVSVRPDLAGSASGLAGAFQLGTAATVSALAGIVVTPQTGINALLGLMFACALAATFSSSMVVLSRRR